MDQLVARWEDSARKGGCPGGKTCQISSMFSLFSSVFLRTVDVASDIGFRRSWCPWKACDTFFLKVSDLREDELGFEIYGPRNKGHQSIFPLRKAIFRLRFWPNWGRSWLSESSTLWLRVSSLLKFRTCGSTRCEQGRLRTRRRPLREESREIFSSLLSFVYFLEQGWHSSWCRFLTILASLESLQYLLS